MAVGGNSLYGLHCGYRSTDVLSLYEGSFATGGTMKFTVNFWYKSGSTSTNNGLCYFSTTAPGTVGTCFDIYVDTGGHINILGSTGGVQNIGLVTTSAYLSSSAAWHNVHVQVDTNQAATSNRVRLWVDGVQVSSFSGTPLYPNQGDSQINAGTWYIALDYYSYSANGYLDLFYYCDGITSTVGNFTSGTGVNCKQAAYSGSFGLAGFLLDFENNASLATLGNDTSGLGNNWTLAANFATTDQVSPGAPPGTTAWAGAALLSSAGGFSPDSNAPLVQIGRAAALLAGGSNIAVDASRLTSAKTYYVLGTAAASPTWGGSLQDGGTPPTAANTTFGWTPGTTALSTPYFRGRIGASAAATAAAAATTLGATSPNLGTGATNTTASDFFVTPAALQGTFSAQNWTLNFMLRASTAGAIGHLNCKIWASTSNTGGAASRLLGTITGTAVTLSTTADVNGLGTANVWSPGTITLGNEYLLFELEWQETTLGASGCNVLFRLNTGQVLTPQFTAGPTAWQGASAFAAAAAIAPPTVNFSTTRYINPAVMAGAGNMPLGLTPGPGCLLHLNLDFTDSYARHTDTVIGTTFLDTSNPKFGAAAAKLDGTNQAGMDLTGNLSDFQLSGDFTIDTWYAPAVAGTVQDIYDAAIVSTQWAAAALFAGAGSLAGNAAKPGQIGTPFNLFGAGNVASPTNGTAATTSVDCPAGSLIVLLCGANVSGIPFPAASPSTVTDSVGNIYSGGVLPTSGVVTGSGYPTAIYYCQNCIHLPSGGTITLTPGFDTGVLNAIGIANANGGIDFTNFLGATTTSDSISTGTLGAAPEIIFGCIEFSASQGNFTEATNFTTLYQNVGFGWNSDYLIVNSTASVTWNLSWQNSAFHVTCIASFKFGTPWYPAVPNKLTPSGALAGFAAFKPTTVAQGFGAGPTTAVIPAGALIIIVVAASAANRTIVAPTDSAAANTYTQAVQSTATAGIGSSAVFYKLNCAAVASGTTFSNTNGDFVTSVSYVNGFNGGLDKALSQVVTSAGQPSIASGTLAAANEILVGMNNFVTYNESNAGPGFTWFYAQSQGAWKIVGTTDSVTYAPPLPTNDIGSAVLCSFKAG